LGLIEPDLELFLELQGLFARHPAGSEIAPPLPEDVDLRDGDPESFGTCRECPDRLVEEPSSSR
jgi:hypothetical protein